MKNSPTPGPWKVRPTPETLNGGDFQARIIAPGKLSDGNDAIIVGNYCDKNSHANIHWPANAYLIAAAPDLLAACKEMIDLDKRLFRQSLDEYQLAAWDARLTLLRQAVIKAEVPEEYLPADEKADLPNLTESI